MSAPRKLAAPTQLLRLTLIVVLAAGLGGVACKKKNVDTEPVQPVEDAEQAGTAPSGTPDRSTEVKEDDWQSRKLDEDQVDRGELSRDEQAERLQGQLKTVYFAYDKDDLNDTARRVIEDNAKVLSLNPGFTVIIEGHCDERGTIEYNLALGQRRAESVRSYLVSLGVDASRLRTVTYGEERPVATGSNESAWSRNRRGAFVVE